MEYVGSGARSEVTGDSREGSVGPVGGTSVRGLIGRDERGSGVVAGALIEREGVGRDLCVW